VARYFAVVDSFDALTSQRHYRHDVGEDAARRAIVELQAGAGTRYDADAVTMFTDLYHEGRVEPILCRFGDRANIPTHDQLDLVHDYAAKILEG
jgi:HD-GYP domain-containing protein (c-di-GMP phosphodiesterase class II)